MSQEHQTLIRRRAVLIAGLVMAALIAWGCLSTEGADAGGMDGRLNLDEPPTASASSGKLLVTLSRPGSETESTPVAHHTTLVPGAHGVVMQDNDLRGFLDGVFKWGWNQPGQMHVRFGRRGASPEYGEHELFRVLQRWDGIRLPPGARVVDADLTLHVETGPAYPVNVLLYRVNRDWNPGEGGTQRDNVSPPRIGEVWWNDARFGRESWGLPGVGYAGSSNDSDTPETALSEAVYRPGDTLLVFSDPGLAAYVQARSVQGEPLLFLLKVADVQEDRPGSLVAVYSADYGDSKNAMRRPRLDIHWRGRKETVLFQESMVLEHGRRTIVGPISVPSGGWVSADFDAQNSKDAPTLDVRGGQSLADTSRWIPISAPMENNWRWLEVRVNAFRNPVTIGDPFEIGIHDTWVLSDDVSEASIQVAFRAPSGRLHTMKPSYVGGYRWVASFVPDEFGTWMYQWVSDFTSTPMVSPVGQFEVIVESRTQWRQAMRALLGDLETRADSGWTGSDEERDLLYRRFLGFERAALSLETPDSFNADSSQVRLLLRRAREILAGGPVPDSIPLVVSPSHLGREEHRAR